VPSGYEDTAWDYVDRAVQAALEGDQSEAGYWLRTARSVVSFLRVQELVNKFLRRLSSTRIAIDARVTAVEILRRIDSNLVTI
jgi:hypothetical protein